MRKKRRNVFHFSWTYRFVYHSIPVLIFLSTICYHSHCEECKPQHCLFSRIHLYSVCRYTLLLQSLLLQTFANPMQIPIKMVQKIRLNLSSMVAWLRFEANRPKWKRGGLYILPRRLISGLFSSSVVMLTG